MRLSLEPELFLHLSNGHRSAFLQALAGSKGGNHILKPILTADQHVGILDNGLGEGDNLIHKCVLVPLQEEVEGLVGGDMLTGGECDGRRGVVLSLCTAFGAEHLKALVVAVDCLAGVVDDPDRPVGEGEM